MAMQASGSQASGSQDSRRPGGESAQTLWHRPTDPHASWPWVGGLSPQRFMQRHWQKEPLLVRGAWQPGPELISRTALFELAAREEVVSRLVTQPVAEPDGLLSDWRLATGPFTRRQLPSPKRPRWTLLVQGVDRHWPAARAWLEPFRFIPDARLDDLMVSYASDGGGVGPHVDSYDVFLLQIHGRRRWRVGPVKRPQLVPGLPLKILQRFKPTFDCVLEPGDLLYVPPGWGHDGVAQGECMTASVGFRAPGSHSLALDLVQRLLDAEELQNEPPDPLYADPDQPATAQPAALPAGLQAHAQQVVQRWLSDPAALGQAVALALGEWVSEPHRDVMFEPAPKPAPRTGVQLPAGSRMHYDDAHLYVNGMAYRVGGRDAKWLRRLADDRRLGAADRARLSAAAAQTLDQWLADGWLQAELPAKPHRRGP